eukprot:5096671-Prymnesium_polylepis.1
MSKVPIQQILVALQPPCCRSSPPPMPSRPPPPSAVRPPCAWSRLPTCRASPRSSTPLSASVRGTGPRTPDMGRRPRPPQWTEALAPLCAHQGTRWAWPSTTSGRRVRRPPSASSARCAPRPASELCDTGASGSLPCASG